MIVPVSQMFRSAYGRYGIGAFNIFNAEQVHGVFRGASAAQAPVIIQITPVAVDYLRHEMLEALISAAGRLYPSVRYSIHLDHGTYDHCIRAIEAGYFQSVMIDASAESYEENIRITGKIVKVAHSAGISVEAELGVLSGIEGEISVGRERSRFTDPGQAREFVKRSGCDALAVAVGTSHGAYKFSGTQGLELKVLEEIKTELPGFPLVLHGASAVAVSEVIRINDAGGTLGTDAKGVSDEDVLKAIERGVTKINIATDMRLIWTRVHREFFKYEPGRFDMVIPGKKYMEVLEEFVGNKCRFLMKNEKSEL